MQLEPNIMPAGDRAQCLVTLLRFERHQRQLRERETLQAVYAWVTPSLVPPHISREPFLAQPNPWRWTGWWIPSPEYRDIWSFHVDATSELGGDTTEGAGAMESLGVSVNVEPFWCELYAGL